MMKIAIVSPYFYPWYGGITEHVYHQYKELKRRGHQVKVITPFNGGDRVEERNDIIKLGIPIPLIVNGSIVKVPLFGRSKKAVTKILKEGSFDVIHMHQPLFCLLGLSFLERIRDWRNRGIPVPSVVGTFHASGGGTEKFLINRGGFYFKRFCSQFDSRIAVSLASRDFVHQVLPGKYEIIPNGVDVNRFSQTKEKITRYDDGITNILFVGRLEPRKGITSLLKSVSLINNYTTKEYRLLVVGNGTLTNFYRNKLDPQVLDKVEFLGDVSFEDLPKYYKTAHIFCSPATNRESFGIVLIEAMASGVPIIAGNNEGYRKVIKDNVNGILVDPENPEALARCIANLVEKENLRKSLAALGSVDCTKYSWSNIVDKLEQIYSSSILKTSGVQQVLVN
ncbi:glycosyltransferase family 4 protein [Chitinispirillales bacterium ANBcel5]|uniref:glycosyltransferase family 4 protein n=1 Tax=Cellulosispirillum alkaliphilum TaxID=3039283 RepID=UPI002A512EF2|nr:glycosyltransferase family 4 protein [Chitinispirillales bacterium ANBcel5]